MAAVSLQGDEVRAGGTGVQNACSWVIREYHPRLHAQTVAAQSFGYPLKVHLRLPEYPLVHLLHFFVERRHGRNVAGSSGWGCLCQRRADDPHSV